MTKMTFEEAFQHAKETVALLRQEYRIAPLFVQAFGTSAYPIVLVCKGFNGDLLSSRVEVACWRERRWWDVNRRPLKEGLHDVLRGYCSEQRDPLERLADIKLGGRIT